MKKVFKLDCGWILTAIKYMLGTVIVIAIGIMYSCERAANTVEIKTLDNEIVTEEAATSTEAASFDYICVHVTGYVAKPGVYNLVKGSRLFEAVQAAGGFLKEADEHFLNLASVLNDGQQIRVFSKEEAATAKITGSATQETGQLMVNINTASKEQLMTLPGIGKTRAESIIAYREKSGGFSTIEDIMKVSGIKESAFEKIKEYICTN